MLCWGQRVKPFPPVSVGAAESQPEGLGCFHDVSAQLV